MQNKTVRQYHLKSTDSNDTMENKQQLLHSEIHTNDSHFSKHSSRGIFQKFVLVWFDPKVNDLDKNSQHVVAQFQRIISTMNTFSDVDECVDFLTEIKDKRILLMLPDVLSHQLIPLIHNIPQLHSIYILGDEAVTYGLMESKWKKVNRPFRQSESIRAVLTQGTITCDPDLLPISVVPPGDYSKPKPNELSATFMYSQIFKEILLDIEHKNDAKEDLVHFWCERYYTNEAQLRSIGKFEREYSPDAAIRWYSRETFIYPMLNQALRTMDTEIIIKMGFFLRDLHRQIEQLYVQQSNTRVPLTVYRGQGMLNNEFTQVHNSQGGLLSFNNFLSTSTDEDVSKLFCPTSSRDPDMTAVLFKIQIDPVLQCTPFASLDDYSQFEEEKEILFSMHTVFRIGQIVEIEEHIWQVELTSTSDNDKELKDITNYIQEELLGQPGWHRLGHLLLKIGKFDKAEEIYKMLLEQTPGYAINELSFLYSQLGLTKHYKGDYTEAKKLYQKKIEIEHGSPYSNHLNSAATYNNIASAYVSQGAYSEALIYYQKALEIEEKLLPSNHSDLAVTYNNIATLQKKNGEYLKALTFYNKALQIYQESRPSNHPDLALIYNNIGGIYYELGKYEKALELQRTAVKIAQKSLPANHPDLAITYCAIGLTQKKRGQYSKALKLYEKALEIYLICRPSDPSKLAAIYSNIASLYFTQGENQKALDFYLETLNIEQECLPPNHPELAGTYNNIATIYGQMKDYCKSLELSNKALKIYEESSARPHPTLAKIYSNIAIIHYMRGQYSEALVFYERALAILQSTLPNEHPAVQECQTNIARTLEEM